MPRTIIRSLLLLLFIAAIVILIVTFFHKKTIIRENLDRERLYDSIQIGMSQYSVAGIVGDNATRYDLLDAPHFIADIPGFENGMPHEVLFNDSNATKKSDPIHPNTPIMTMKYRYKSDWIAVSYYGDPIDRPSSAHPVVYKFCSWRPYYHTHFP